MKHQLKLNYSIPVGDLNPYFDALRDGKALASECNRCGKVAFPARIRCGACGDNNTTWKPLTGSAQILFRTDGGSGSFAIVKFDGADTCSTVALKNPDRNTTSGKLTAFVENSAGLCVDLGQKIQGEDDEH
jgi:hypothetical protein